MTQMTPPIDGPREIPEPPQWPKVVGIISVVWGSLMICCGACGIGFAFMGQSMIPPEQASQYPPMSINTIQLVAGGFGFVLNAGLIVAGSLTIGRRPIGRTLHLVYAAASLPLLALSIYGQILQQADMDRWVRENPDTAYARQAASMGSLGALIGYGFALVFGLAYPLFCLLWFGVIKRSAQSMGAASTDDEPLESLM